MDFAPREISRYRHLTRYRQIAQTLARHGFGYFVVELGLRRFLRFHPQQFGSPTRVGGPEHLRLALQELGATFIKLGQLVSTRADLLPAEYIAELVKLQDSLPPLPYEVITAVIERELGSPPEQVFARFAREPIAAASTSQVHEAELADGRKVVVKVQRPGVAQLFEVDLEIIRDLARAAEARTEIGEQYDLTGLAEEMAATLRPSLNYTREARNIERFRDTFADEPTLYIPEVYHELSTSRVLTMERLEGVKISDQAALSQMGIDRHDLAMRSVTLLMKMVFENGLFHGDPHPGNFFVLSDGRLGVMDFGLVGHLGESTREELSRLFVAVVAKDSERVVQSLTELGMLRRLRDRAALGRDIERLLEEYYELPLGEVTLSQLLTDAMRIARRRGLQLPTNLALLVTVIAANEGMGRSLDPDFKLLEAAQPYARHLLAQSYRPQALLSRLRDYGLDLLDVTPQLPRQVHNVLRQIERGNVEVGVSSDQIEGLARELRRSTSRLALSVVTAAFVVALAIMLAAFQPAPFSRLISVILAVGFLTAAALGVWLIVSILRT